MYSIQRILTLQYGAVSSTARRGTCFVFYYARYERGLVLLAHRFFEVVANARKVCLIYDTWYFIAYEKYEKRIFESM